MAAGDVTTLAVSASGIQATFRVEGINYFALSDFETGKSPTFDVTKEGYSGVTLGTRNRTDIPCDFVSAAAYGGTTLFSDTCTEGSDTALTSHTPDTDTEAAGWATNAVGTWTVVASVDRIVLTVAGGSISRAWFDAGVADGVYAVTIANGTGTSRYYYIIFRYVDESNYLSIRVTSRGTSHLLRKTVAGVTTTVATDTTFTTTNAGVHAWVVTLNGDNVKVSADGNQIFDDDISDHNTATLMGIGCDANYANGCGFDTLSFASLPTHADVTVSLFEPINNDDTSVTMSMAAGGLTDGVVSSSVVTDAAVTNNSTLDYPKTIGRIAGVVQGGSLIVDHGVVTGTFTVEGIGGHFWHNESDDEPLERMRVVVSDGTNSVTADADTMTASAYTHQQHPVGKALGVYSASINPATGSPSALDAGALTVTVTFYPWAGGDADSVRSVSWTIYYNPASALTTTNIYVAGSTGNDTTGDGSTGNPYQSLRKGMNDTLGTTTETIYNIYLKEAGTYTLTAPSSSTTDNGPLLTIAPDPAGVLTNEDVVLSYSGAGPRVRRLRVKDMTLKTLVLQGYTSSFVDDFCVVEGCIRTGVLGRDTDVYDSSPWMASSWGERAFILNSRVVDLNQRGVQHFQYVRDVYVEEVTEDIFNTPNLIMGAKGINAEDTVGSLHCDAVQFLTTGDINAVLYCLEIYDMEGQGLFADVAIENALVLNCIVQQRGNTDDVALTQFGKSTSVPTIKHLLLWNNTIPNQRFTWPSVGTEKYVHVQMRNNIIGSYSASAASFVQDGNRNHAIVAAGANAAWSTGTAAFQDGIEGADTYDNTSRDYRLTDGSDCAGVLTVRVCSFDAVGDAVPNDGSGAIGALQDVPVILTAPADLATDQPTTLTFSWEAYSLAGHYHLFYTPDGGVEVEVADIEATSHQVSGLDPNTEYTWYVVAHQIDDTHSAVATSETWTFTTAAGSDNHSRTTLAYGIGIGF